MFAHKTWVVCVLFWIPAYLLANGNDDISSCAPALQVTINRKALKLEAKVAPLGRVLDEIANKTKIQIHHSALPEQRVTVTCNEATVEKVMECLLGLEADFIVRYSTGILHPGQHKPEEIWLLSNGWEGDQMATGQRDITGCAAFVAPHAASPDLPQSRSNQTAMLVQMASAEDPTRRAQGLSGLSLEQGADPDTVRRTLESALSDADAGVRAQAVAGLARRGGDGTTAMLREALRDSDASVRLMAVSTTGSDAQGTALLREALADSHETVRELAAMKLYALLNQGRMN